jgi:hypothetical protein
MVDVVIEAVEGNEGDETSDIGWKATINLAISTTPESTLFQFT